ncbi:type I restriction-modification system subunit M [Patescibacteria group bacterium]
MANISKSNKKEKLLSIGKVAEIFSVHKDTLRNWEEKGLITPLRVGSRKDRRYRPEDIEKIMGEKSIVEDLGVDSDKMNLTQLKQFLWKSADILRGSVDSSDYKNYVFGLLFYKRISDVWGEEYNKILDEFQDEEIARADYNHRFDVPEDCRWEVVQNQAENIGQKLNEIFDKITNANSPKLDKIFNNLNFADKDRFSNETLQKLINHFSEYSFGDTYISSDLLGDAYEYLIEQFAADAGKKGGEFYTPREVERVIINILKPHEKDHIYDPTVGSAGFLLEAYHYLKEKAGEEKARSLFLYGQEKNIGTYAIAKINTFLHGLDGADIRRGDTLSDPLFLNADGTLKTFDIVVANFPYSIKEWNSEAFKTNKFGRLDDYEMPPVKNADYAFILHIIKSMNKNGRAGVVVPHGVLFKSDVSGKIREQIIKNDLVEAVIGMPSKLFFGVGIPVALFVLNKNKTKERKNKILVIDAEKDFEEGKKQNRLRKKDIEKVTKAFEGYKDIEKYARVVDIKEIEDNEFNLNIRRFVDTSEEEETIDVKEVVVDLKNLEKERDQIFH